jgi:superfamily II DNA or RNA helicase
MGAVLGKKRKSSAEAGEEVLPSPALDTADKAASNQDIELCVDGDSSLESAPALDGGEDPPKRKRGRPRKNPIAVEGSESRSVPMAPEAEVAIPVAQDVEMTPVRPDGPEAPNLKPGDVPDAKPLPCTTLRPRQGEALKAIFDRLSDAPTQLVSLPTGVGKTVLATHVALRFEKVLFLVHRKELMDQAARTFARTAPSEKIGFIHKDNNDFDQRFTIGMIGTMNRRLAKIPKGTFDCVIVDEAHHAAAKTWRNTVEHFDTKLRLGLSATPERADGAPLNDMFGEVSYEMNIKDAVLENLLVYPKAMRVKTKTSLDGVGKLAGDFVESQLANVIDNEQRNNEIVSAYLKVSPEHRKALVFCAGIEHAESMATTFRQAGVAAEWIAGDDPERDRKLADLNSGKIRVMCNAMLLTEGYDDPSISMVVMARPTLSRNLYTQCIGRGLRLDDNKDDCIILDFVDSSKHHNIMDAWRLMGVGGGHKAYDQPIDMFRQKKGRAEKIVDLWEDLYDLHLDFQAVDVLIQEINLFDPPKHVYTNGTSSWMLDDATPAQIKVIQESGGECEGWTKGQACQYIDGLPPTKRQAILLLALGYDVLDQPWTRGQAGKAIEEAKAKDRKPNWNLVNRIAPKALDEMRAEKERQTSPVAKPAYQQSAHRPYRAAATTLPPAASGKAPDPVRAAGLKAAWNSHTRGTRPAGEGSLRYYGFLKFKLVQSGVPEGPYAEVVRTVQARKEAVGYRLLSGAIEEAEKALDDRGIAFRR